MSDYKRMEEGDLSMGLSGKHRRPNVVLPGQVLSVLGTLLQIQAGVDEEGNPRPIEEFKRDEEEDEEEKEREFQHILGDYNTVEKMIKVMEGTVDEIEKAKKDLVNETAREKKDAAIKSVQQRVSRAKKYSKAVKNTLMGPGGIREDNNHFKADMEEVDPYNLIRMLNT
jgi:hypothetical protein